MARWVFPCLAGLLAVLFGAGCGHPSDANDGGSGFDGGVSDGGVTCTVPIATAPPCSATDLGGKLACIPGMTVTSTVPSPGIPGYTRYELTYEQPVNHDEPNGAKFAQRLSLLFRDSTAPTVLSTSGYGLSRTRSEPANLFSANQVAVEHRYFAPSIPADPVNWKLLDITQSAKDFHRIRTALAHLFPARWVSTGASKGGMTMMYYRRFFPCDVNGTVAYVAPHSRTLGDPRDLAFLADVGGATRQTCRDAMTAFQRAMLTRRAELEPYALGPFTRAGSREMAYEHMAIDMSFAFWQYQSPDDDFVGCAHIPAPNASVAEMTRFIDAIVGLGEYSDDTVSYYQPYYYQASTQLGEPAPYEAPVADLLLHPGTDNAPHYAPPGVPTAYSPAAMEDVGAWLSSSGSEILLVYGELDPWTATPFELGGAKDSARLVAPLGNHGSKLKSLTGPDFAVAREKLERWLAVPLPAAALASPWRADPVDPEDARFRPRR